MYRHHIPITFLLGGLSLAASIFTIIVILQYPNSFNPEEIFALCYSGVLAVVGVGLMFRKRVFRLLFVAMMLVLIAALSLFLYDEYSRGSGPPRLMLKVLVIVLFLCPPLFFLLVATHQKVAEEFS